MPSLSSLPATHLVAMSFRKHVPESKSAVVQRMQIKDRITDVSPQLCFHERLIVLFANAGRDRF